MGHWIEGGELGECKKEGRHKKGVSVLEHTMFTVRGKARPRKTRKRACGGEKKPTEGLQRNPPAHITGGRGRKGESRAASPVAKERVPLLSSSSSIMMSLRKGIREENKENKPLEGGTFTRGKGLSANERESSEKKKSDPGIFSKSSSENPFNGKEK